MAITTATESQVFVCATAITASVDTIAEYNALAWIPVGEIEDLGTFGDESAEVTFSSVGDGRVRKLKGARNAGTMALVTGRDPADAGQLALKNAERTKFEYGIKVVAADAVSGDFSDSVYYFRALVMSATDNYGTNDNVVRTTFNLGINSPIIEIPSAEI